VRWLLSFDIFYVTVDVLEVDDYMVSKDSVAIILIEFDDF
jgi:hypothetical protein